jgi:hypothetical protein
MSQENPNWVVAEGVSEEQVVRLLSEMEMLDENGEAIWEESDINMDWTETMVSTPDEEVAMGQTGDGGFGKSEDVDQQEKEKGGGVGKVQGGNQKKPKVGQKNKWGVVVGEWRSTRIRNDGRTSLEKAQDQKKKGALEDIYNKGKHNSAIHLNIARQVGVDLGRDEQSVENNLQICMEFAQDKKNSRLNGKVACGEDLPRGDMVDKKRANNEVNKMPCESSNLDRGVLIRKQPQKGIKTRGKHPRKKVEPWKAFFGILEG